MGWESPQVALSGNGSFPLHAMHCARSETAQFWLLGLLGGSTSEATTQAGNVQSFPVSRAAAASLVAVLTRALFLDSSPSRHSVLLQFFFLRP